MFGPEPNEICAVTNMDCSGLLHQVLLHRACVRVSIIILGQNIN